MTKETNISKITLISLYTALIIAGTFLRIPIPPVPITLQTFFVYFASLTLGPLNSLTCVFMYLFLGLIGIPVFTAGGGPAAFLGPTGGFLVAMLISSPTISFIAFLSRKKPLWWLDSLALIIGTIIIYTIGTFWFLHQLPSYSIKEALLLTCVPFLIGDVIKIVLAVILSKTFRPVIQERLQSE